MLTGQCSVDKANKLISQVVIACPSCGIADADSPHRDSSQCVHALEMEVRRLSELLERVRQLPGKKPRD